MLQYGYNGCGSNAVQKFRKLHLSKIYRRFLLTMTPLFMQEKRMIQMRMKTSLASSQIFFIPSVF